MADKNIITTSSLNLAKEAESDQATDKPVKKAPAKKTTKAKSAAAPSGIKDGYKIVYFESGSSYTSNGFRFTKDNRIQEVPEADADILLEQENFRLPTQVEVDDYFNSREE
jgi:hypothetical protein